MAGGRHVRARTTRSWGQRLLVGLGAAVTVACVGAAGAVSYVYERVSSIERFDELEGSVTEAAATEPQNILIVGSDSREELDGDDPLVDPENSEGGGQRADTIIVARVEPDDDAISMLSFPRDLMVEIAGTGSRNRINSAYGEGRDVLIETLQDAYGIDVNHYVEVDFTGFQRLVDAIGGVPINLDTTYRDRGSFLEEVGPGCVTLSGAEALSFARSRSLQYVDDDGDWTTDGTGDLGRISRQQLLVELALGQVQTLGIGDVTTLNSLLGVAVDSVGVDPGFSLDEMRALSGRFRSFDPSRIETLTLTTTPRTTAAGADVLELDEATSTPALNVFRGLDPNAVSPGLVEVVVQNGSGTENQATDTAAALDAVGFASVVDRDSSEPLARTTVFHGPDALLPADLLARHLTSGADLVVDPDLDGSQVRLVTGADFTTVGRTATAQDPAVTATTATTAPAPGGEEGGSGDGVDDVEADDDGATSTTVGIVPQDAATCA